MENINKVFINGRPLDASELNLIVDKMNQVIRYIDDAVSAYDDAKGDYGNAKDMADRALNILDEIKSLADDGTSDIQKIMANTAAIAEINKKFIDTVRSELVTDIASII